MFCSEPSIISVIYDGRQQWAVPTVSTLIKVLVYYKNLPFQISFPAIIRAKIKKICVRFFLKNLWPRNYFIQSDRC
jgi:hypothetical protein